VTKPGDEDRVADEVGVSRSDDEGLDTEAAPPARPPQEAAEEPSIEQQLAERTADLQRLQAEYVNYRKRVERDRALARTAGEASVLRSLLTVLDDIGRAEKHGELEGGFKAVADALHQAVKAHRLESFGAPGEAFDPKLHEALFHSGESSEVEVTTIDSVVRTGYRIGDDVIRHAQVGVVDPGSEKSPEGQSEVPADEPESPLGDEGAPSDEEARDS
jgi:molecular chaperone GrpE